ncbi:MAG: S26 family signal peptidase [Desulfobulbus sp.]|uniref:S26 family signal peptidase n=1 Tax=Desulfobulbus sp. TaxID=895 RepID=UPI00284C4920|nr:S26 family signal peptidase [Desulfobulbus sp.]MDR2548949.1 S26 family signal peptidase [Desulfobulbus sp.]
MTRILKLSSSRPWWRLNRREQTVVIVFFAFLLAGAWLPGRITVATSGSLDHRVFFLLPVPAKVELGDYLVFRHQGLSQVQQGLRADHDQMIKRVGCLPGEQLTTDEAHFFTCNGRPLGQALEADSKGRLLPHFSFNGSVPADKLFMVGTHPRSYDSKYYGFIDVHEISHQALPLW